MDLYEEALARFEGVFERARKANLNEPTAMTLATVDALGYPSARTVLLKTISKEGFVFYTNLTSAKGRDLMHNPNAALCFFWDPLMEQVRVQGHVVQVPDAEANTYWQSRPRMNQLASMVSKQSQEIKAHDRGLNSQLMRLMVQCLGKEVPRPNYWTGFRLVPKRIEFWTAGRYRMSSRINYELIGATWKKSQLYP